jgi:hypothetical protein
MHPSTSLASLSGLADLKATLALQSSSFFHFRVTRVARFLWVKQTKTEKNYTNLAQNGHKIFQMNAKYFKWPKIYQHLPFQGPPKNGIFGHEKTPSGNTGLDADKNKRIFSVTYNFSSYLERYHRVI